jgi:hypothetical protein
MRQNLASPTGECRKDVPLCRESEDVSQKPTTLLGGRVEKNHRAKGAGRAS